MPGIAGIISRRPASECQPLAKAMLASMEHEPFYTSGTYSIPELGLYTGWLAHANSFADKQVFQNEQTDIALVFSGECFVDAETKSRLKQNGHKIAESGGDCLVHLYEEQGKAFFENLNGLFSGLLIDKRQRKIFLFNDRYGMERIYWHETPDAFYFATEAKALLRVLPELREFDAEGVAQFLGVGCTLGGRTLFSGVSLLPGGSLWTFENGRCNRSIYFSPEPWEQQSALSPEDFEAGFGETFKKILPRYFESESKIGIALTGGLDTRMIMACRPETNPKPVCYTFTGTNGETLDDRIAARVASACGLEHHRLRLGPDFLSGFAAHADRTVSITDGTFGILGAHEIYFNRQARGLSPVRLTGNYGSEVFRGVSTFKPPGLVPQLFHPDFADAVHSAAGQIAAHKKHPGTFALFQEIPWNLFGSIAAGRSQVVCRTPYLDNALAKFAYQMPADLRKSSLPAARLIQAGSRFLGKIPTDRGFAGGNSGPAFLCRRLWAEATFKLDYYHNEGLPRALAAFDPVFRFTASKLKLVGRHKCLHYSRWFRNELAAYARQKVSEAQARRSPFFNPDFLGHLVAQHVAGGQNYTPEINAVLTLESVERQLFRELPRGLEPG